MRKLSAALLAFLTMLCLPLYALAAEPFTMAGFDDAVAKHDWDTNLFFERMKERTGVEFSFTQYDDNEAWTKAKADMLSGQTAMPDVLFKAELTPQETMAMYDAGLLLDLRPYLEKDCPNLWALLQIHPAWLEDITLPNGAIAALPGINQLQLTNAMWINQAWLDNLGLSMPTTAEELTEVLQAFRDKDANKNGKSGDEIPLTFCSLWDLKFLGHAFGIISNDYGVYVDQDGTVRDALTSEENRALITWLHELWQEGLLDPQGFTGLRALENRADSDKNVTYGVMLASTPQDLTSASVAGQYVLLEPLTYEGKQIYRDLTGDIIRGTFAISAKCKDPETLLKWVDYLYTEEGYILADVGEAGVEFDWNDDGTWTTLLTNEMLAASERAGATIYSGGCMPGLASVDFQQKCDDTLGNRIVAEYLRLHAIDSLPYPLVYLTEAQQQRVDELQMVLGRYAEERMVWFVAGDVPLNDETWADFCQQVEALGMPEMLSIFQSAL